MNKISLNYILSSTIILALFTSGIGIIDDVNAQSISDRLNKAFEKVSEKSSKTAEKLREVQNRIGGSGGGGCTLCG